MQKNRSDALFRRMAAEYAASLGAELNAERAALEQDRIEYITPRLDARVREISSQRKKRQSRWAAAIVAAAACIAVLLVVPNFIRYEDGATPGFEEPADIIPLNAELPENFTVEDVKLDRGKTVYRIDDANLDDVVMTLEYSDGDESWQRTLTKVERGGFSAYGKTEDGYQLLMFEKGDIRYTLTCKYDINTLVALGEHL